MTRDRTMDEAITRWLEAEASAPMPERVLRATFERTRGSRQVGRWPAPPWPIRWGRAMAIAAGVLAAVTVIAGGVLLANLPSVGGLAPSPTAGGSVSASATPAPTAARIPLVQALGRDAIGWSSDGTRLLFQKDGDLYVLHVDGSEVRLTTDLGPLAAVRGSSRPVGASISPDGKRVVYAGLTKQEIDCHHGALFVVDADGGTPSLLWASPPGDQRGPLGGIVRYPTFSPDGTHIAFVDGYCDHDHRVWIMNADGTDPHPIVANDVTLGAGHVYGLAWSPAGDRLSLRTDATIYTFKPDGSDFKASTAKDYCWTGRWCPYP